MYNVADGNVKIGKMNTIFRCYSHNLKKQTEFEDKLVNFLGIYSNKQ